MTPLGKFLQKNSVNKADVYYKTGIDESRLSLLSNDENTLLFADEFYLITLSLEDVDLTVICEEVFASFELKEIKNTDKRMSDFGQYLSEFTHSKQEMALKLNIKQSRLSKLINEQSKRLYAHEIYLISKIINKEPAEVFKKLYGHLELNSIEKQNELKEKSRQARASRN